MKKHLTLAAMIAAALLAGCGDEADTGAEVSRGAGAPAASSSSSAAEDSLPAGLRLASAPAEARDVADLKATVKDGDRVVVRGVVAGRADPIAENRAILTLLDAAVQTCDKNPDDGCKTPWDACCEPADVRAKNSVSVRVVDAEGRPAKASFASVEGVRPLAKLVVSGTAKVSADGAVLVDADGVHVVP